MTWRNILIVFILTIFLGVNIYMWTILRQQQYAINTLKKNALSKIEKSHGTKIAYIQLQLIEDNLLMAKTIKKEIALKNTANDKRLAYLINNYKDKKRLLEEKQKKLTPSQVKTIQNELDNMQNAYMELKNSQEQELKEFQFNQFHDLRTKILNYLKTYSVANQIDLIINSEEDFLYYKNSKLDISQEVIQKINTLYSHKAQ